MPKLSEFAHRVSLATRRAGGFSEEQLDVLRSSAKPLAAAMEIQVNRLITENLLAVYLGLHPAQRVLAGAIKPGDVVLGDVDGVLVVPRGIAYDVLVRAEEIRKNEEQIFGWVHEGQSIREITEKGGYF